MAKFDWSSSQRDAIFTRQRDNGERCNLLVSAAAGSGKTAVLVQRITEKLIPTDYSESIDASRLLVVTFTNAAAHEMAHPGTMLLLSLRRCTRPGAQKR